MTGEDLLARAMQHEIDHLNGILFLSHLSAAETRTDQTQNQKADKAGEWE